MQNYPHSTLILKENFENIPLKSCNTAKIFIKLLEKLLKYCKGYLFGVVKILFSGDHFSRGSFFQGSFFLGIIFPGTIFPGDHFSGIIFPGTIFPGIIFPGFTYHGCHRLTRDAWFLYFWPDFLNTNLTRYFK